MDSYSDEGEHYSILERSLTRRQNKRDRERDGKGKVGNDKYKESLKSIKLKEKHKLKKWEKAQEKTKHRVHHKQAQKAKLFIERRNAERKQAQSRKSIAKAKARFQKEREKKKHLKFKPKTFAEAEGEMFEWETTENEAVESTEEASQEDPYSSQEDDSKMPVIETVSQMNSHEKDVTVNELIEDALELESDTIDLNCLDLYSLPSLSPFKAHYSLITVVNLGGNKLYRFPQELSVLHSLSELYLYSNQLDETSIPDYLHLTHMKNLHTLSLGNNNFTTLPRAFAMLPSLTSLDLHSNRIQAFTRTLWFTVADRLVSLNLGYNQLSGEFDGGFCLKLAKNLEKLYIQGNQISSLPQSMKSMRKLTTLKISANPLVCPPLSTAERGPEAVRRFFASLDRVGSSMLYKRRKKTALDNKAMALNIRILKKKKSFEADEAAEDEEEAVHTDSSSEPQWLSTSCPARDYNFGYRSNRIRTASVSPPATPLRKLSLKINPMPPSAESSEEEERDVKEGLALGMDLGSKFRDTTSDSWNRSFKIIVIGNSGAGKTSLVKTLIAGESVVVPREERTLGIDISSYTTDQEYDTLAYSIWDFAGQKVYHGTHQFFLSNHALYLLVWDINVFTVDGIDRAIMFWIYSIQARVPGAVIQIVASKCDDITDSEIDRRWNILLSQLNRHEESRREALELQALEDLSSVGATGEGDRIRMLLRLRPQVLDELICVSSKHHSGFHQLKKRLSNLVLNTKLFPHMGIEACVPTHWAIVEDTVMELESKQGLKYIKWEALYQLVVEAASNFDIEVSNEDLGAALAWLNDSGHICNSRNSIIFLDPVWLVEVIKQVVDHSESYGSKILKSFTMKATGMSPRKLDSERRRLRNEINNLRTRAQLSDSLLPYIWDGFFDETAHNTQETKSQELVVEHLLHILEQFDICYELALQSKKRCWLVPCLLAEQFHLSTDFNFQNGRSSEDLLQLGRKYSFESFSPPGLMARVLSAVCSSTLTQPAPPQTWANAAKFSFPNKDKGFRLLFYLAEDNYSLTVCTRGTTNALVRMWEALVISFETVEKVLLAYPGLIWRCSVPCPVCFQLHPENIEECHEFPFWDLDMYNQESETEWREYLQSSNRELDTFKQFVPCDTMHDCPLLWLWPPSKEALAESNTDNQVVTMNPEFALYELSIGGSGCVDARAIVRVGVYDRLSGRFKELGSGFVVDKKLGLIVTAAHLVVDAHPVRRKYDLPISVEDVQVHPVTTQDYFFAVGLFVDERKPPMWTYAARALFHGACDYGAYLDAMVIQVTGKLQHTGITGLTTVTLTLDTADTALLPLKAELTLGDSSIIRVGDPVSSVGYPPLRGDSICCDSAYINQLTADSHINCTAFQHDGSSGGPLVNKDGHVIGIMSKGFKPGDFGQYVTINSCRSLISRAVEHVSNHIPQLERLGVK